VSGQVFYLVTVFTFFIQGVSLSLESGLGYYAVRNTIADGRLTGFAIAWSLGAAAIAVLALVPASALFGLGIHYPLTYPASFICGNLLIAFGNAFCYSKYRFVLPGAVSTAVNLLLIVILLATRQAGAADIFIPVYFFSFFALGIVLFLFIIFGMGVRPSLRIARGELRQVFRYSLHAFTGNLLFLFINRIDYFFVERYCSSASLGNYIQVSKIAQLFFMLPSMISAVLFPVIAGGRQPAAAARVRTISVMILIVYGVLLAMLAFIGRWLFPVLYGVNFDNMFLPYILLIPGIIGISTLYPYTAYYSALDRIDVKIKGCSLALAVIVAGDWLFIPRYGIAAAALVSSAGYLVFQQYVMSVFRKEFNLPLIKLFMLDKAGYKYILQQFKR